MYAGIGGVGQWLGDGYKEGGRCTRLAHFGLALRYAFVKLALRARC